MCREEARRARNGFMAKVLDAQEWASLVYRSGGTSQRDSVIGVSVTLAAYLLGVSRSRVQQLLRAEKLAAVDVYDERRVRIGHLITLSSIARRRRAARPRRTQWRPFHGR
jgi:hypothetical protein